MSNTNIKDFTKEEMKEMLADIRVRSAQTQNQMSPLTPGKRRQGLSDAEMKQELQRYVSEAWAATKCNPSREEDQANAPINDLITTISTERLEPLVNSFWEKIETADLTVWETRIILVEMFVEIISLASREILNHFRNNLIDPPARPPLVSESAVKRALHSCFECCFKPKFEDNQKSMDEVFDLVSGEVTSKVNSALSRSSIQDSRLVLEEDHTYRTPHGKLVTIVKHAKVMLQKIRKQLYGPCCGPVSPEEELEPLKEKPTTASPQQDKEEKERNKRLRIRDQLLKSGLGVPLSSESPSETMQQGTTEDQISAPKTKPSTIRERLGQSCAPCEDQVQSEVGSTNSQRRVSEKRLCSFLPSGVCIFSTSRKSRAQTSPKVDSYLSSQTPLTPLFTVPDQDLKQASPTSSRKYAAELVKVILEKAAVEIKSLTAHLSREDQEEFLKRVSLKSEDAAASIVSIIFDEMSQSNSSLVSHGTKSSQTSPGAAVGRRPCLFGVRHKVQSFFALCYAEDSFRELLTKMYYSKSTVSHLSFEDVMEEASYCLKQLVKPPANIQEKECFYETLFQEISNEKHISQELFDVIFDNMNTTSLYCLAPYTFYKQIRKKVAAFMDGFKTWLKSQQHLEPRRDPVHKTLYEIKKVVTMVFPQEMAKLQALNPEEEEEAAIAPPSEVQRWSVFPPESIRDIVPEGINQVTTMMSQTAPGQNLPNTSAHSVYEWKKLDIRNLAYEVVSRVLQTKHIPNIQELVSELQQQLGPKMAEWNVKVSPDIKHIENVAKAVHSDLCEEYEKEWVALTLVIDRDFTQIMDSIQKHLEMPKKRSRFSSFVESVHSVFCRVCRGRKVHPALTDI